MKNPRLIGLVVGLSFIASACSANAGAETTTTTVDEWTAVYEAHPSTKCFDRIYGYFDVLNAGGNEALALKIGVSDPEFELTLRLYHGFQGRAYQVGVDTASDELMISVDEYCTSVNGSVLDALDEVETDTPEPSTATTRRPGSEGAASRDSETGRLLPQPTYEDGTVATTCGFADTDRPLPEEVTDCLFIFWNVGDRAVPDWVATPDAIDQMFQITDWEVPSWVTDCRFEETSWGTIICDVPFDHELGIAAQAYISGNDTDGYQVQAVGIYNNPPGWVPVD